jgi:hypothetical protein
VLQRLQLRPQHACQPVLFEREGLQRIGLDRQFRDSDGGGGMAIMMPNSRYVQEPVASTLRRREQHHLTRVTATARCGSRAGISMPSSHAP